MACSDSRRLVSCFAVSSYMGEKKTSFTVNESISAKDVDGTFKAFKDFFCNKIYKDKKFNGVGKERNTKYTRQDNLDQPLVDGLITSKHQKRNEHDKEHE
jgi:hypothetical protein